MNVRWIVTNKTIFEPKIKPETIKKREQKKVKIENDKNEKFQKIRRNGSYLGFHQHRCHTNNSRHYHFAYFHFAFEKNRISYSVGQFDLKNRFFLQQISLTSI